MTREQKNAVRDIANKARDARRALGTNAGDGARARPTLKQINAALDAFDALQLDALHLLASTLSDIE